MGPAFEGLALFTLSPPDAQDNESLVSICVLLSVIDTIDAAMRYFRVELGGFEPWMWADKGPLGSLHRGWTQQPRHWTLFFFEHDGQMTVNNRPENFSKGDAGLVVPGAKVEFDRVGEGTFVYSMTFGLVSRIEAVAIPAVKSFGDSVSVRRQDFSDSIDWLQRSIMRGLACAFNVLWCMAEPLEVFRKSDLVFDAEALITDRLAGPISVAGLARELGISHGHLLRLFREEHDRTILQYIRDKRAEIARHLITETDMPLKEVAVKTGMPDLQYFNKVVRTATGLSPRALREMAVHRTKH